MAGDGADARKVDLEDDGQRWRRIAASINQTDRKNWCLEWGRLREKFYSDGGRISAASADILRLGELKDKYVGHRIFIIGNGPSLLRMPLHLLADEFSFGVNRIYMLFDRIKWKPTFYTANDWRVVPDVCDEISALSGMTFFFDQRFRGLLREGPDIYWYEHLAAADGASPIERGFSSDLRTGARGAGSVVGTAVQIATHLGFDPIYLIGCDLGYTVPSTVKQEGEDRFGNGVKLHLTSTLDDDPNHFDPAYFGKGRRWHDPNVKRMIEGHMQCRRGVEALGRRIYNATLGGELEVYERVDFQGLFSPARHDLSSRVDRAVACAEPLRLGPFTPEVGAHVNEAHIAFALFKAMVKDRRTGTLIDVGAHHGSSLEPFAKQGWKVTAFEPDPDNRRILEANLKRWGTVDNVHVVPAAVSDMELDNVPYFASKQSSGVSGLSAFLDSHQQVATVSTTRLDNWLARSQVAAVDVLKVDVEGFELSVLRSFPWDSQRRPMIVVAEFEDGKTVPNGYTTGTLVRFLRSHGYDVYSYEWHPITKYGADHTFRQLTKVEDTIEASAAWGNLLALDHRRGYDWAPILLSVTVEGLVKGTADRAYKVALREAKRTQAGAADAGKGNADPKASVTAKPQGAPTPSAPNPPNSAKVSGDFPEHTADTTPAVAIPPPGPPPAPQAFYAPFADWLRTQSPPAFTLLRLTRRAAAGVWRRRAVTLPALLLLAALPVAAFAPGLEAQRWLFLGAGAFLIAMAAILYVALRMYKFVFDANAEIKRLAERIADLQQANARLGESAGGRAETIEAGVVRLRAEIDKRLAALKSETGMRVVEIDARIAALRGDVDQHAAASGDRLDDAFARLEAEAEERRAGLDASAAHIDALKAALDQRGDALAGQIEALAQAQDTAMSGLQAEASLRAAETEERITTLAHDIRQRAQAIGEELNSTIAAVRAELDKRHNALGGDLDALVRRVSAHRSEAEDERDALRSVLEMRIGELSEHATALQAETERAQAGLAEDVAARTAALDAALAAVREGLSARIGAAIARMEAADTAAAQSLAALRGELTGKVDAAQVELEKLEAAAKERDGALRTELAGKVDATQAELKALEAAANKRDAELASQLGAAQAALETLEAAAKERDGALRTELATQISAARAELQKLESAAKERDAVVRAELAGKADAAQAELKKVETALRADLSSQIGAAQAELKKLETLAKESDALRAELAAQQQSAHKQLTALKDEIAQRERTALDAIKREFVNGRGAKLRERIASTERQIAELRYPDAPKTLVFFGHHKCASRFFRDEVFTVAAEAVGARVRRYKIAEPPFHYSMSDELDLVNMDFTGLGENGRDVVLFSNATARSLERLDRATQDWRGVRVLRDPRQVLVSNYFHHKGAHHTELNGWVWDQLARDKPILRELPEEEGLLYELDSISKQIIETQLLAPFDDPRVMTIKIEDFAKDPQSHLKRISEFLGVADIAGLDFTRTAANPESGPWRRHFTSKLREVFKERYGQALIDLGYAEDLLW